MAKYYAYISGGANVPTSVFNPYQIYQGNGKALRIEYVGNITTDSTSNVYVWRQSSGNWFSLEQGSFQQYLNLGSTTYVTDVINTAANRRKFNSDDPNNPAVFSLVNGQASLTFDDWTTTGTFSGNFPNTNVVFFPSSQASNLKMDFYEFKVYDNFGTLELDFVPDYSGTTKGLRDKVSGNFYAATDQSKIELISLSTFETDITAITATYNSTTCAVTLTADEDMAWTASTLNDWITLSTTGGTGSSVFTVSVAANKAYAARNGLVTLTNGEDVIEITVEQAKYPLLIPNENIYRADLEVVKGYRSGSTINKAYRSGELIYYKLDYSQPTPPDYRSMPLTFKVISGGTISWRATSASFTKEIFYSINDGPWTSIISTTAGNPISLNTGDIVKFQGDGAISTSSSYINRFRDSTIVFEVYGNIMSLIDSTGFTTATTAANHSFRQLFASQTGLTSAENLVLPATTIGTNVYKEMFKDCTSLTTAPELPAETLAQSCYMGMFKGCTSLTTAPELPASTLAQECYKEMFYNCTNLTTAPSSIGTSASTVGISGCSQMFFNCSSLAQAPELPATIMTNFCYYGMFRNCTSLTSAPALPPTTLAEGCYYSMFNGCTSLTSAPPELPATTLLKDCYNSMFNGCTSLTSAPATLPATTLADYCYYNMFYGCIRLTSAPVLPATTLATSCYSSMFRGCTGLTSAPVLPATTLATSCYDRMFYGCRNLNYIKCLATDISASNCTYYWVNGVSSTGTFVTPSSTNWTTDNNGIPSGWTRVNA